MHVGSTATAEFKYDDNATKPSDFASTLKNCMKAEEATTIGDLYNNFIFLEIEPLPFFKRG